jgi:hypothetical protein
MKRIDFRILIGAILISAGVLFFLQTLNILSNVWSIIWIIIFFAGSGIFFYLYLTDRRQWWAIIPATTFLGLAGTIIMDTFFPDKLNLGGILLLGGIGFGFFVIYLTNRDFWWAIIPGGVLVTLGVITISEEVIADDSGGGIFFIGLAITFTLVGLLAKPRENFWWAFIPASVLFILGVFLIGPLQSIFNYLWPIALILIGGILLIRNLRNR